jgi:hydrogenase maturation protease
MHTLKETKQPARIAFIGIGNTLAGDDGAGIVALDRLRNNPAAGNHPGLLFGTLTGDLYAVTDFLETAHRFIFLDAILGSVPGELCTLHKNAPRALSSSLHQTDIGTVMESLYRIRICDPFPDWEIHGISISSPDELRNSLSPAIERAVDRLVQLLIDEIRNGTIFH